MSLWRGQLQLASAGSNPARADLESNYKSRTCNTRRPGLRVRLAPLGVKDVI
jgi:hypothetical protein